ncbi:hypothetical protein H312_01596 [Anncaliia algerae PRA339]|uniref:Coatomer subunit beta n=1 Tax=Anncaliia algerae PRA339 TaxID=1288291 RepID=A0A059F1Z9_9MICR|nr:hypothetical protein H312_01596 [Anncaliia algerae PRA339]
MATFYYSGIQNNYIRNLTINLPSDYKKIHEIMRSHSDTFSLDLLLYIEKFPYYLDDIFFTDALVFPNYLRRMALHPNEYFRGKTLKVISYITSSDILSTLNKPILDNLYHSSEYVRRNAYLALNQIIKNQLVEFDINNLLESETNPINRFLLYKIKKETNKLENISELGIILSLEENYNLCLAEDNLENDNPLIKLHSLLHFIRHSNLERNDLIKFINKLIELLKENPKLKFMKLTCLKEIFDYNIESIEVLSLYESNNTELNMLIFDYVRKNNKIIEVINLYNYILNIYESNLKDSKREIIFEEQNLSNQMSNDRTKVMLLDMLNELVQDTHYYNDNCDVILCKYLQDDNPQIQFKSLQVIEEINKRKIKKDFYNLIKNNLHFIKFGKIIRKTIEVIKELTTPEESFEIINYFKTDKLWYIALIYNFIKENKETFSQESKLKGKVIDLLMSIKVNEDIRVKAMINLLLRTLIALKDNPDYIKEVDIKEEEDMSNYSLFSGETKLPEIIKNKSQEIMEIHSPQLKKKDKVIQLSSINDPMYLECILKMANDNILLELILINNTSFDLKDIKIDFITSENLLCVKEINPFLLKKNSVKEVLTKYKITNWNELFLIGEIHFFYTTDERNIYKMNLEPIKVSILENISPNKVDLEEFRKKWGGLEWENISTIRKKQPNALYDLISMDSKLDELKCENSFDVSIFSVTVGDKILLGNLVKNSSTIIRIRGEDEEIVKNFGQTVGQFLREGY